VHSHPESTFKEIVMSTTFEGLGNTISTSGSKIDGMYSEVEGLIASGSPSDLLKAQLKMSQVTMLMTANSEIVKALGEGSKSISKNMSV
jgi:hypothetical protein